MLNEGKPFTPVFVVGTLVLLGVPQLTDGGYWLRQLVALVVLLPLFAVFYRYAFPLRLRAGLWVLLATCVALSRVFDPAAIALVLGLYLGFTVVLWGSIYYHLRIGTPWTNGLRFWRLVLENPDPTSGNFLEQVPKLLILVLLSGHLVDHPGALSIAAVEAFTVAAAALAVLSHQWWFTWAPPDPLAPTRLRNNDRGPLCRRVILIVIDGCRADRFAEARTPFLDRLAAEGVVCEDMRTVYPARTVTAFTSMLTGATPRMHGMRSNFVPSPGAKCESIFGVLEQRGLRGRLAGIAHLVDSFGEQSVETVTAVTPNEEIDEALVARAREVLQRDDPELLVLQTLSVDQTGHARGSYYPEYIERIEATDRLLEEFLGWCRAAVYLDADLGYDPAEIPALLAPIEAGEANYVLGSRFLGRREGHARWRSAGNRVFTLALSFAAGRRISDGQTGFRAFSARALNVAEIVHDYNYAQVLTLDLLHKGMRLAEVPISYRSRPRGGLHRGRRGARRRRRRGSPGGRGRDRAADHHHLRAGDDPLRPRLRRRPRRGRRRHGPRPPGRGLGVLPRARAARREGRRRRGRDDRLVLRPGGRCPSGRRRRDRAGGARVRLRRPRHQRRRDRHAAVAPTRRQRRGALPPPPPWIRKASR